MPSSRERRQMAESVLDGVLTDLATECAQLDALVADLPDAQWRLPTPAEGWDIATTIAHLAWTDEVAVIAATDKAAWDALVLEAIADPSGFVDKEAVAGGRVVAAAVLAPPRGGPPPPGPGVGPLPPRAEKPGVGPPPGPPP